MQIHDTLGEAIDAGMQDAMDFHNGDVFMDHRGMHIDSVRHVLVRDFCPDYGAGVFELHADISCHKYTIVIRTSAQGEDDDGYIVESVEEG